MATTTQNTSNTANTSTKVIRIQDEEKEILFRLREIYGNDYKKYGEYIRREADVPLSIKKIYKLLDERKAYRRISDYFHRERAAKKAKDTHPNGILNNGCYTRSGTRGITQVPDQISSPGLDHEMEDDEDDDLDQQQQDDENNQHSHPQADSPTNSHTSDDFHDKNHSVHDDEHPRSSSNHQRKRLYGRTPLPLVNDGSVINGKSNLLTIRLHLEKALNELDRAIISKDEQMDSEQTRSTRTNTSLLLNGHRHSKLDDIVRSLSNVVSQQQENTRVIIDESSVLMLETNSHPTEKPSLCSSSDTQEALRNVLDRLNALVDRGNSIYDRVESILSEM